VTKPNRTSLHPELQDLFSRAGQSSGAATSLPLDLIEDVPRRLVYFCAFLLVVSPLGILARSAAGLDETLRFTSLGLQWGLTLGMLLLAWSGKVAPQRLIDLGLVFEVALVALFSASSADVKWYTETESILGWSPAAVLILIYPAIVPNTLKKTLIASTVAAMMEPLVVLTIIVTKGEPMPSVENWVAHGWPLVVAVALATLNSKLIYNMGEKLSRAKSAGSYHLIEKLGEGGMGEVWRAEHRMLARPAAVKLILPERLGSDPESRRVAIGRFEREAQVTATLRSPHTIELFDFGVARDGTFYFVMELLDGMDLDSLVEDFGPQPAARVVHLLRQACHSLHEAHLAGIIHRDIKPANMFVCRYGGEFDFVKVLDFGLVKHRAVRRKEDRGRTDEARLAETAAILTQVGRIAGTPAFMAPELALGDRDLDGRVDIYALGCVGYWLLTKQLVFEKFSTRDMLLAHVGTAPDRPSTRGDFEIPKELEDVILQCLEKDRNDRPPDAKTLSRMLADVHLDEQWTDEKKENWWAGYK
jgi:serine/threonine-protein kinase